MPQRPTLPAALETALETLFGADAGLMRTDFVTLGDNVSQPTREALGQAMAIAFLSARGYEPDGESEDWSAAWREIDAAWGITATPPPG